MTGHAGPVTDRTRWSSQSRAPTKQQPDALQNWPDVAVPVSGWSPVSSMIDRTRPVNCDRTRHRVRSKTETHADTEHWPDASGQTETVSGHFCDLRPPPFLFWLLALWKIVVLTPRKRLNPASQARREGERTPNPLYRSNSNYIINVLTPPSDHVMCECVSIFTIIFRGVISSIQMHMIMKCTPRGT
jgi:hypothetical protein